VVISVLKSICQR